MLSVCQQCPALIHGQPLELTAPYRAGAAQLTVTTTAIIITSALGDLELMPVAFFMFLHIEWISQ
jgi:hypothetical protein